MTQSLTTDQKVDVLLSQFSVFGKKLDALTVNQNDLIKTVGEVALLSGTTADKLENLSKEVSGMKDEQERQGKKLDGLAGSGSFTNFTNGAFVA